MAPFTLPSGVAHFLWQCFREEMKPEWRMNVENGRRSRGQDEVSSREVMAAENSVVPV